MKDYREIRIIRSKAIRLKCLDCCSEQANEVKLCQTYSCPLWRYRTGHEEDDELNPNINSEG